MHFPAVQSFKPSEIGLLENVQSLSSYRPRSSPQRMQIESLGHFALHMLQCVVVAAGPRLVEAPGLMARLQVDMLAACMRIFRDTGADVIAVSPLTVARMSHLMLTLYQTLRGRCILQIEVFIQV
jgi:hypothetical protein